jgi:hypothetical protein
MVSIYKNAANVFNTGTIIYKSDSKESEEAYDIAKRCMYSFRPEWKKSSNLKEEVVSSLESISDPFVCLFSEGDLVFRDIVAEADEIGKAFDDPMVLSFSMRLGTNTTKCYFTGIDNRLYGQEIDGNVMRFDWQKHYMDYSNPFSMNGSIFRTSELLKMVKKIQFNSSLELEDALHLFQDYPKNKMATFNNSAVITIPNTEIKSMVRGSKPSAPENNIEISKGFIAGERIDLDAMNFSEVNACYIDMNYLLKTITENAQ